MSDTDKITDLIKKLNLPLGKSDAQAAYRAEEETGNYMVDLDAVSKEAASAIMNRIDSSLENLEPAYQPLYGAAAADDARNNREIAGRMEAVGMSDPALNSGQRLALGLQSANASGAVSMQKSGAARGFEKLRGELLAQNELNRLEAKTNARLQLDTAREEYRQQRELAADDQVAREWKQIFEADRRERTADRENRWEAEQLNTKRGWEAEDRDRGYELELELFKREEAFRREQAEEKKRLERELKKLQQEQQRQLEAQATATAQAAAQAATQAGTAAGKVKIYGKNMTAEEFIEYCQTNGKWSTGLTVTAAVIRKEKMNGDEIREYLEHQRRYGHLTYEESNLLEGLFGLVKTADGTRPKTFAEFIETEISRLDQDVGGKLFDSYSAPNPKVVEERFHLYKDFLAEGGLDDDGIRQVQQNIQASDIYWSSKQIARGGYSDPGDAVRAEDQLRARLKSLEGQLDPELYDAVQNNLEESGLEYQFSLLGSGKLAPDLYAAYCTGANKSQWIESAYGISAGSYFLSKEREWAAGVDLGALKTEFDRAKEQADRERERVRRLLGEDLWFLYTESVKTNDAGTLETVRGGTVKDESGNWIPIGGLLDRLNSLEKEYSLFDQRYQTAKEAQPDTHGAALQADMEAKKADYDKANEVFGKLSPGGRYTAANADAAAWNRMREDRDRAGAEYDAAKAKYEEWQKAKNDPEQQAGMVRREEDAKYQSMLAEYVAGRNRPGVSPDELERMKRELEDQREIVSGIDEDLRNGEAGKVVREFNLKSVAAPDASDAGGLNSAQRARLKTQNTYGSLTKAAMEAPDFVEKSLEADNAWDGSRDATKDKYMTWNERRVYRYYLAIGQEDKAEEYYGALDKLELKSRKAAEDAEDWDKAGFLGHLAFGAYSGTAGALKSMGVGLLGFLPAAEDLVGELTADPLQSELQQQAMQELGDGVEKFFGQVGSAAGSIAPVLAANLIAPGSGVGAVFLQSYGAGIQQGLRSGASDSDARLYGFLNAAVNTAAWGLGARLGGSGGGYLSRALENQAGRLVSSLAKSGTVRAALGAVAKPVTTGIANGLENYTTVLADQVMRNMILNESNPVNPFSAEAMNAFGVAAVTGILYSIPEVPGAYRESKIGAALLETPGGAKGILDAARQLQTSGVKAPGFSQAIRQAESNQNVYNIGKLANIVAPGMRAYLLTEAGQTDADGRPVDNYTIAAKKWVEEQLGENRDYTNKDEYGNIINNDNYRQRDNSNTFGEEEPGAIIKDGKIFVDDLKANPNVFSGKSAKELVLMLNKAGYDVTIKNSTRSRSGAEVITINNPGGGKNISQVQISPGGGRHGVNPYVKISTTDQGVIKIVDGIESLYQTDGLEKSTIIFTGGK